MFCILIWIDSDVLDREQDYSSEYQTDVNFACQQLRGSQALSGELEYQPKVTDMEHERKIGYIRHINVQIYRSLGPSHLTLTEVN